MVSPVSEILLLSKMAKFPFRPMDYSPWSSKNLIDWNQPKKFMQVGIDDTYMHTNFGGRDLSNFGDTATFKKGQIPLQTIMSYSEDCLSALENFINNREIIAENLKFHMIIIENLDLFN